MSKVELVRAYKFKISTYQVDRTGKLSLPHLFSLFQDAAHRDAMNYGFGYPQMLQHSRLWILSRLSLEIDRLPGYDDQVELLTWVKSVSGPRSEREFVLVHKNESIVRGTSLWFCLSSESHRPARIPMQEQLQELINDKYAVPGGAKKVEGQSSSEGQLKKSIIKAKYSDVDMLNHVNNAAYVRWVIDEARITHPKAEIKQFTINYLDEVQLDEEVEVKQLTRPEDQTFHELVRLSSGTVVCRTKTTWEKA